MGALESVGKFAIGAVQGLDYGLGRGMDLTDKYYQIEGENRKREAQAKIAQGFKDAAAKGGMGKMDQSWFDTMAGYIADTGDLQSATGFTQLRNTFMAERAQKAAQTASIALMTGNLPGAVGSINEAFSAMGIPSQVTGLAAGPDGKPAGFTMADGSTMPVDQAVQMTDHLSMAKKDALAYGLDKTRTEAQAKADEARAGQAIAETGIAQQLAPLQAASYGANIAQSQAAARASDALANERTQLLPFAQRTAAAEATGAEVAADIARQTAPTALEQKQLDVEASRQALTEARNTEAQRQRLAEAQTLLAEHQAANPPVPTDQRFSQGAPALQLATEAWDTANTNLTGAPLPTAKWTDPFSPILRTSTQLGASRLVAESQSGLTYDQAVAQMAQSTNNLVGTIYAAGNEDLTDQEVADASAQILSLNDVRPFIQKDANGASFILVNIGGQTKPVYLTRPPVQQAIPAPAQ